MGDVDLDLDPALVARVAAICLALPEAHEQDAWIGVRWRIRQRTFAHLATWTPAVARSSGWPRAWAAPPT